MTTRLFIAVKYPLNRSKEAEESALVRKLALNLN